MAERREDRSRPHGLEARVTMTPFVTRASNPCARAGGPVTLVVSSLCLLLNLSTTARAQRVEVSSPLDGYARPGRAVGITIRADGLAGPELTVGGEGVIAARVPVTAGRVDATVPLVSLGDPPAELRWSDGRVSGTVAVAARPVAAGECLVAVAGDVPDAAGLAGDLFPGRRPVVVRLDPSQPGLLRPPQAFEAADAVLLDLSAAARVGESQLRAFLAAGTAVAIRTPVRPPGDWPWRQHGDWRVLRHDVAGPRGVGVDVDAYAPTFAWDRSRPAGLRRTALLAAAASAMLLVGATLLRGRRGLVAAVGTCAIAGGAAALFGRSLDPVVTAAGEVIVVDAALAQADRWTYASALRDARAAVDAGDLARPVLGTRGQLAGLDLSLACDADGTPARYEFALPAGQTVAFVSRSVAPAGPVGTLTPGDPPINLIADRLYPGAVVGQAAGVPAEAPAEWWGTVVMRK